MIWILLLVAVASASNSGTQLDYTKQHHWGHLSKTCTKGTKQSPIDVPAPSTNEVYNGVFLDLPESFEMVNINNANTAKYEITPSTVVSVPWIADREITLVQVHVHWGATDARGSEHLLQGRKFAAELHLVTSYTDENGGTKYMVFARVFVVGEENEQLGQMISANEEEDADERNIDEFDLSALYPADAVSWYTYAGSLTTPGCDEVVDWVIVKEPLEVSAEQLEELRNMELGHHDQDPMSFNWRETQATNGRESKLYWRCGFCGDNTVF